MHTFNSGNYLSEIGPNVSVCQLDPIGAIGHTTKSMNSWVANGDNSSVLSSMPKALRVARAVTKVDGLLHAAYLLSTRESKNGVNGSEQ